MVSSIQTTKRQRLKGYQCDAGRLPLLTGTPSLDLDESGSYGSEYNSDYHCRDWDELNVNAEFPPSSRDG